MNQLNYFAQKISPDKLPQPTDAKITDITNIAFAIFGAIAVLIVVWAGIQMIISQGNSEKVAQARRTIIYAVAGLIVIMMAQVIVWFVVNRVSK